MIHVKFIVTTIINRDFLVGFRLPTRCYKDVAFVRKNANLGMNPTRFFFIVPYRLGKKMKTYFVLDIKRTLLTNFGRWWKKKHRKKVLINSCYVDWLAEDNNNLKSILKAKSHLALKCETFKFYCAMKNKMDVFSTLPILHRRSAWCKLTYNEKMSISSIRK